LKGRHDDRSGLPERPETTRLRVARLGAILRTMNRLSKLLLPAMLAAAAVCCGAAKLTPESRPGEHETGLAVYYADSFQGKKTANGETFDQQELTAAHRELPFGTVVRVTNLSNRRSVQVRINDRGPFGSKRRIIDLTRKAAERIDMISAGVVEVKVEVVSLP
jgi:rare lipoprotein A